MTCVPENFFVPKSNDNEIIYDNNYYMKKIAFIDGLNFTNTRLNQIHVTIVYSSY